MVQDQWTPGELQLSDRSAFVDDGDDHYRYRFAYPHLFNWVYEPRQGSLYILGLSEFICILDGTVGDGKLVSYPVHWMGTGWSVLLPALRFLVHQRGIRRCRK